VAFSRVLLLLLSVKVEGLSLGGAAVGVSSVVPFVVSVGELLVEVVVVISLEGAEYFGIVAAGLAWWW